MHLDLDWAYEQQTHNSQPNYTPVIGLDGKTWFTKTRPLYCPVCRVVFFVYQPMENPWPPYDDSEPSIVNGRSVGARFTCGHPRCQDVEHRYQMKRGGEYQRTVEAFFSTPSELPSPTKLTKRSGLKKFGS